MRTSAFGVLVLAPLFALGACGGDVNDPQASGGSSGTGSNGGTAGSGGKGGTAGSGADAGVDASCYDACVAKGESPSACDAFCFKASDAGVDKACYDSCIAKGAPPSTCEAYCSGGTGGKPGTGGTSGSGGSSAGGGGTAGAGTGGSSTGGSGGVGGVPDPAIEKPCIQCLNDPSQGGGVCAAEANACLASLACSQLEWCPTLCGKPNCLPECNSIIPTGVAPLTALVKCMACGNGPCANACKGALVLSYCN